MRKELLKEINRMKNLTSKLMTEQFDGEKPDKHKCLKRYLDFAFEPTEYYFDDDEEIDFSDGSSIIGGGDLGLWNKNEIPSADDEEAFKRFEYYLMTFSSEGDAIYDDDECNGIYFDDMEPILKELYLEKIESLSGGSDSQNDSTLDTILSIAENVPQEGYEDPFDWMNAVFSEAELELDDDEGMFRSMYGDDVLNLWGNTTSLEEQYDDDGKWVTKPPYEGIFKDNMIMLVREDADVVKYTLNNLPDSIEMLTIANCEYADFSGVDLCDKKDLVFVNLAGTENNFEEQGYKCLQLESESFYTTTKGPNIPILTQKDFLNSRKKSK